NDGDGGGEVKGGEVPRFEFRVAHDAKLKELLHMISPLEIKLCSDGVKEFIRLLNGNTGGELLHLYVRSSCNCSELLDAWKLRRGKPISTILGHPDGVYDPKEGERIAVSKVLNKFASLLVVEYMVELQKELDYKEAKCQNAALLLLASIVRRQSGLASEVAKKFDFKSKTFAS
ncbi:hypothetical protein CFP56_024561, partial [Quercus suber]